MSPAQEPAQEIEALAKLYVGVVGTKPIEPSQHRTGGPEVSMDPLSDVLSLLESRSYAAGGFPLGTDLAVQFHEYEGIKCYAVASGECWLSVEGVSEPLLLKAGDCILLPRGRRFPCSGPVHRGPWRRACHPQPAVGRAIHQAVRAYA